MEKLDDEELRFVIEHELLHHVSYRRTDNRSPLMSNIVLDVAVNKTLYLYDPIVAERASKKIYNLEEIINTPVVLACPTLDAKQIESIGVIDIPEEVKQTMTPEQIAELIESGRENGEKLRNMYIEIWGSRKTINDFNQTVPSPLNLFYKLVEFVDVNIKVKSPFGEDSDDSGGESQEESENNSGNSGDQDNDKDSKGQKKNNKKEQKEAKAGKGNEEENQNDSEEEKKDNKTRNRCITIDPDDEDESDNGAAKKDKKEDAKDSDAGNGDDEDGEEDAKDNKDSDTGSGDDEDGEEDAKDNKDSDAGNGDDEDGEEDAKDDKDGQDDNDLPVTKYSAFEEDISDYADKISDSAKQAGKQKSNIRFVLAQKPTINTKEIERLMLERVFEKTIDEIGALVDGAVHSNVVKQPFVTRPTRTTLTHMACGVTDYLPIYYNKQRGEGKPKIGCYVDVSGSMEPHMRLVHAIMNRLAEFLPSATFIFHDSPMPMPTHAWQSVMPLGGGTNFDAVLSHACMPVEEKRKWFNAWNDEIDGRGNRGMWYLGGGACVNNALAMLKKYGLSADMVSEDFPVILMITDCECGISQNVKDKFISTGKTLLVLHLVEGSVEEHPFNGLATSLYQINQEGKIIRKE
jgi:hypothetical protein